MENKQTPKKKLDNQITDKDDDKQIIIKYHHLKIRLKIQYQAINLLRKMI